MAVIQEESVAGLWILLAAHDRKAWDWLSNQVHRKFRKPVVAGKGPEDFANEALFKFETCLVTGKVDTEQHPVPFVLCIATHRWIDWRRRHKWEVPIADLGKDGAQAEDIGKAGKELQTPVTILEESEDRQSRRDEVARALEAFGKAHGPASSFRLLQAVILHTKALNSAWRGTPHGTSTRNTQRYRKKILAQAIVHYFESRGKETKGWVPTGVVCKALLTGSLENR